MTRIDAGLPRGWLCDERHCRSSALLGMTRGELVFSDDLLLGTVDAVSVGARMNETELIAAARLGDEDAFAELYRQHIGYVKAIGRSILRNREVDDMCQETFLLAFMRLDSFEGNARFRTWITRIAINRCLLILRKGRQASNGESHLVQMDGDPGVFATKDAELEGVGTRLDLEQLLGMLKPTQRRILEMAYLEDMPDLQIAATLGTTVVAVKCTLYRVKRILRNAYKKS
jgi:RNA polymerase sigma-70 factor, ECF subfamily